MHTERSGGTFQVFNIEIRERLQHQAEIIGASDGPGLEKSGSGGIGFWTVGVGFLLILKVGFGFYMVGFRVFVGFIICAKKWTF